MFTVPLTILALAASTLADPTAPKLTYLYSANTTFGATTTIGAVALGTRNVQTISGGTFSGPKLSGKVGAGLDYGLLSSSGTFSPDAVYTLHTDDNATVLVFETGHAPGVTLNFETSSTKYAWLNTAIAYGIGTQSANGVTLDVWQIGA